MNLALFDFDGTITTGDGFLPFLRFASSRARVLAALLVLSPVMLGYRRRWLSPTQARQCAAWFALRGRRELEIGALGERYAREVLPGRTRPEALERIRWHQAQGDRVVVVSASLDVYLAPWCRAHGVELLCTELELRGGRCTGKYRGPDCTGEEKARRVRASYELERYAQVFAYGDTAEDAPLLRLAQRRYFRWQELGADPLRDLPLHPA